MRKTVVIAALLAAAAFFAPRAALAQELEISGEVRTGFYMEQEKVGNDEEVAIGGATNNDGNSGGGAGRVRMDFRFTYENVGLRVRFQIEPEAKSTGPYMPKWNFIYAYANTLQDQLTISGGLLGESPWGTGGHRLWSEPETREFIQYNELSGKPYIFSEGLLGIRFEYKPAFLSGLNVGFVLNQADQIQDDVLKQEFGEVLGESVIGAAYEHELFAVRVGYRFDSKADKNRINVENDGGRLTYRLEERVLTNMAEGMKVWLNGLYYGLGSENYKGKEMVDGQEVTVEWGVGEYFINWLYWQWDTPNFITGVDVGFGIYKKYLNLEMIPERRPDYQSLEFHPAFYYKLLDNLLQVGVGLGFGLEFGEGKTYKDAPYQFIYVEPQIKFNIGTSAYIAAVYNFTDKYQWFDESEKERRGEKAVKHSLNIRAVYTF